MHACTVHATQTLRTINAIAQIFLFILHSRTFWHSLMTNEKFVQ